MKRFIRTDTRGELKGERPERVRAKYIFSAAYCGVWCYHGHAGKPMVEREGVFTCPECGALYNPTTHTVEV